MMKRAIGLTRRWVGLYTKGLPPEVRDARRAEIESDLWEQGEDGTANGSQPDETALQVFVRLLLGVPAIKTILQQIISPTTWIEWETLNLAENGNVVFTERIDRFEMGSKKVELPVAGVFEIEGSKIKACRDYFDMAAWTR